jgi:two-component sensor histidine kinase
MRKRVLWLPMRIIERYTGPGDKNSIEYWQRFIFYVIALAGIGLGTLCLIPTATLVLIKGQVLGGAVIVALYAVNVSAILVRRISIRTKTLVIAFNFYLFGLSSLILAGPEGESGIWFSVSVLLCSLFVGTGPSIAFALFDFLTGIAFGVLHSMGLIGWEILRGFQFRSWVVQSANILMVDMMFVAANAMLIRGVGDSFRNLNAAEGRIRASLVEKETLIRELYHRSKNNMQVVSSLLMLHSGELEAEADKRVFRDVISRIGSMSLVHQKLYESKDLSNIDMAEYLRDLAALTARSYGASPEKVGVELDLESVSMPIDTALPCGLVVSEIIANALKYAFPEGREGRIGIRLRLGEGDIVELRIADDGVGLPEGFRIESQGKMGLKTLRNIVTHQLQGSLRLASSGGVAYDIRFKRKLYEERIPTLGKE